MHLLSYIWIWALYYTVIFNAPLLIKIYQLNPNEIGTLLATIVIILCIESWIISVFTIRKIGKPLLIALTLITSITSFATFYYGVIFDHEMIVNIVQTNSRESVSYLNWRFVLWFISFGLLPSFIIYKIRIHYRSWYKDLLLCVGSFCISFIILIAVGLTGYKTLVSNLRNHHALQKMLTPVDWMYSTSRYFNKKYLAQKIPYQQLGLDAKQSHHSTKPRLIMLVVGETARRQNYQAYEYGRDTNIYTQPWSMVRFKNATSCGTATAVSLPCMFSSLNRKAFSIDKAARQDNVLDIINRVGIDTYWFDNNAGCKGVCKNVKTTQTTPNENHYDEILLNPIKHRMNSLSDKDTLMVIHLLGSHGPDYYLRYPPSRNYYQPECRTNDIHHCSNQALVNTYDNSIRYTDFVISQLIELLNNARKDYDTSLIYLSDHGESLGEHGLFLHGTPYSFAPKQQKEIPFMIWFPDDFAKHRPINKACLIDYAENAHVSHDNLFHSLLGLLDIETSVYQTEMDIFNACRIQKAY